MKCKTISANNSTKQNSASKSTLKNNTRPTHVWSKDHEVLTLWRKQNDITIIEVSKVITIPKDADTIKHGGIYEHYQQGDYVNLNTGETLCYDVSYLDNLKYQYVRGV